MKQIFSKKIKRDHKLISIAINNKHPETKVFINFQFIIGGRMK